MNFNCELIRLGGHENTYYVKKNTALLALNNVTVFTVSLQQEFKMALCGAPTRIIGCLIMWIAHMVACVDREMSSKRLTFHVPIC
jgi:hypothetical protein